MKGTRLILLISSILLLTISSGLLFYKNIFLLEPVASGGKVNFEELHTTDLQINATVAMLRLNLNVDPRLLENEITRIKELLNIITDINKSTPELSASINKIRLYFEKKFSDLNNFKIGLAELKKSLDSLNPSYNELNRNKIKFSLDNKDFYRECVINSLFYASTYGRESEIRLTEDRKVLGQILTFATVPNPIIQNFSSHVDTIFKRTKEINSLIENFNKDNSINTELNIVGKYYLENEEARSHDREVFLSMVLASIALYLIFVIVVLKKLG